MKNALLCCLIALTAGPAAALDVRESKALEQAGAVTTSGGSLVYDGNVSRGAVTSPNGVRAASADPCVDETCGFRRGGPAPTDLKKEPKSPFTGVESDADKAKKKAGFNWMSLTFIVGGALGGALTGFLIGGWVGALIGAVVGGLLGWLAPKLLR
jgi:hypothetical protein